MNRIEMLPPNLATSRPMHLRFPFLFVVTAVLAGLGTWLSPASWGQNAVVTESPLTRNLIVPLHDQAPTLHWHNEESLEGQLMAVTPEGLRWKSRFLPTPMSLRTAVLDRIEWPVNEYKPGPEPFRILLADGSVVTGEVREADEETLTLQSHLLGRLEIRLDQLVTVERLHGAGITFPHAQSLLLGYRDLKDWRFMAGGGLATPAFHTQLNRAEALPSKGRLRMRFHTADEMHFTLAIHVGEFEARLETWEDELVIASGTRFVSARRLSPETDRTLAFDLCWDADARAVELHAEGNRWARLDLAEDPAASEPDPASPPPPPPPLPAQAPQVRGGLFNGLKGLFAPKRAPARPRHSTTLTVHNRGAGMWIDHFQVAEWSGEPPPAIPATQPRVETSVTEIPMTSAIIVDGQVTVTRTDGSEETLPLDEIRRLHWPRTIRKERDPEITELWFDDGQLLRGDLLEGRSLSFQTAFSREPLVTLPGSQSLRALVLAEPSSPEEVASLDSLDVLSLNEQRLHGRIALDSEAAIPHYEQRLHGRIALDSEAAIPHFFPVGSTEGVPLEPRGEWSLLRRAHSPGLSSERIALAHIHSGESVPLTLKDLDKDRLLVESPLFEASTLETANLHAIQFVSSSETSAEFGGTQWRALGRRAGVSFENQGVVLAPDASIGHPDAILSKEVSFRLHRVSGNVSLRVKLLTRGTDAKSEGVSFLIAYYGNTVYCGPESKNHPRSMDHITNLPVGNDPPTIRFTVARDEIELHVNGSPAGTAEIGEQRKGSGMIIASTPIWDGMVGEARLSDFTRNAGSFSAGVVPYTDQDREEALLLPRLRRHPPPQHILVGANGDLLRGDLESLTQEDFAFRAGLETVRLPLERLAAIVWVNAPAASDADGEKEGDRDDTGEGEDKAVESPWQAGTVQWLDLGNGGRMALSVESWTEDHVRGTHPWLGPCQIPTDLIFRITTRRPAALEAFQSLADWQLSHTPDPVIPGEEGIESPLIGTPAPDFSLVDLEGDRIRLDDLKGKVVVLDFWATWCGPCVRSLPGLIESMAAFTPDEVVFLTVNQGEPRERVADFLEARGLEMSVLLDGDQSVGSQYGADAIPYTVVIGPAGVISFVKLGADPATAEEIVGAVRKALGIDTQS